MNRLILLGNGFDLAHGMETSYNHFILWYLKKRINKVFEKEYEDELLRITPDIGHSPQFNYVDKTDISKIIDFL